VIGWATVCELLGEPMKNVVGADAPGDQDGEAFSGELVGPCIRGVSRCTLQLAMSSVGGISTHIGTAATPELPLYTTSRRFQIIDREASLFQGSFRPTSGSRMELVLAVPRAERLFVPTDGSRREHLSAPTACCSVHQLVSLKTRAHHGWWTVRSTDRGIGPHRAPPSALHLDDTD
jgi:hypothetical protein